VNTQTVAKKFNIQPGAGLLLYPEDVEKDDWLHNPDPGGKEPRDCSIFSKRGAINVGSLILMTFGVMALFIGYPVVYARKYLFAPTSSTDTSIELLSRDIFSPTIMTASQIPLALQQMYHYSKTSALD